VCKKCAFNRTVTVTVTVTVTGAVGDRRPVSIWRTKEPANS